MIKTSTRILKEPVLHRTMDNLSAKALWLKVLHSDGCQVRQQYGPLRQDSSLLTAFNMPGENSDGYSYHLVCKPAQMSSRRD